MCVCVYIVSPSWLPFSALNSCTLRFHFSIVCNKLQGKTKTVNSERRILLFAGLAASTAKNDFFRSLPHIKYIGVYLFNRLWKTNFSKDLTVQKNIVLSIGKHLLSHQLSVSVSECNLGEFAGFFLHYFNSHLVLQYMCIQMCCTALAQTAQAYPLLWARVRLSKFHLCLENHSCYLQKITDLTRK